MLLNCALNVGRVVREGVDSSTLVYLHFATICMEDTPLVRGRPEGVEIGSAERGQGLRAQTLGLTHANHGSMRAVGVVHVTVVEPQVGHVGQRDQGSTEGHHHGMRDQVVVQGLDADAKPQRGQARDQQP